MKLEILGRNYEICGVCGTFISSPRCLACSPLTGNEEWIDDRLKQYYQQSTSQEVVKDRGRPVTVVRHHILEYFFTRKSLIECGQYFNVPDRFILEVKTRDHFRRLEGISLHSYIYEKDEEMKELLRTNPDYFLKWIPERLYELFKTEALLIQTEGVKI